MSYVGPVFAEYTPEAYISQVRYVFDLAKDRINRAKHGVSLALAEVLFAGPHVSVEDDRFDYGEVREVAFGLINDRFFSAFMPTATMSGG